MSRLVKEALKIVENSLKAPLAVIKNGRRIDVFTVLERWCDIGLWWEGETYKVFFRLQLEGGKVWEIYLDTGEDKWFLYKIYD